MSAMGRSTMHTCICAILLLLLTMGPYFAHAHDVRHTQRVQGVLVLGDEPVCDKDAGCDLACHDGSHLRADRGFSFKSDEGDRGAVEVEAENMMSRLRSCGMSAAVSFRVVLAFMGSGPIQPGPRPILPGYRFRYTPPGFLSSRESKENTVLEVRRHSSLRQGGKYKDESRTWYGLKKRE
ncbi:hypothetical protein B0H13DRAFT_1919292 [Mycena leptocephala]|nr:hypothetical protein B0H13DRAFT_1919292 [Mycena leptocephala]